MVEGEDLDGRDHIVCSQLGETELERQIPRDVSGDNPYPSPAARVFTLNLCRK
jgi:hypothetical protein